MQRSTVKSLPLMLFCWALSGRVSCQEIGYNRSTPTPGKTRTLILTGPQYDADDFSVAEVYRATAGSRPGSLIDDVVKVGLSPLDSLVPGNISLRGYRENRFKRKSGKSNWTPIWPLLDIENNRRNALSANSVTREWIFYRLAYCQVYGRIASAIGEPKPLKVYRVFVPSPSMIGDVYGWITSVSSSADIFPVLQNVSSGDKPAEQINKKASAGYGDDLEPIVFVGISTNDRNDGALDSLYCFDGHVFRFVRSETAEAKCNHRGVSPGGDGVVSDQQLRTNYRLIHSTVRRSSKPDQ